MKKRPIILNDEMVRAILDGRKTQTRRVIKPQPPECTENGTPYTGWQKTTLPCKDGFDITAFIDNPKYIGECPYGKPGDRMWVRETFGMEIRNAGGTPHERIAYRASKPDAVHCYDCNGVEMPMKWKPPANMARRSSRITLEITNVRVERVQDIGEMDVIQEGFTMLSKDNGRTYKFGIADTDGLPGNNSGGWHWKNWSVSAQNAYSRLWKSIYGPDSWAANPWVWVIEFRRVAA